MTHSIAKCSQKSMLNLQFFPTMTERSMNDYTNRSGDSKDTREKIAMVLQNGDADDIGVMLEQFQPEYTEVRTSRGLGSLALFVCILMYIICAVYTCTSFI
jgi:hypothetical protein